MRSARFAFCLVACSAALVARSPLLAQQREAGAADRTVRAFFRIVPWDERVKSVEVDSQVIQPAPGGSERW